MQIKLGKGRKSILNGNDGLNREEVLRRSREENKNGDERELRNYKWGMMFAYGVGIILTSVIYLVSVCVLDRIPYELSAILFGMMAANDIAIGVAYGRKKKLRIFYLCVGIFIALVAVYMLVMWGLQLGGVV